MGNLSKEGLRPWCGKSPKVLILGTLPGNMSIRMQAYYQNKSRNSFWKIMQSIFPGYDSENEEKYITSHGIALWDCLKSGDRMGSTDSGFCGTMSPNDLERFLDEHPTIHTIVLNGKSTYSSYFSVFFSDIVRKKPMRIEVFNSTANTNAKPFEVKLREWSKLKELLD